MTKRITSLLILGVVALGMMLGFSMNDNPHGSKSNSSSKDVPLTNPPSVEAAYYTDLFNGANDTTALKDRGYKVWYRGGGPQGVAATWFQGNPTVFNAYEGPTTGYVACNYQVVGGLNNIDSWLVLPALNVANGDTLSFWCRSADASTYPDSFRVMYSSVGDSTPEGSWTELGRYKASTVTWEQKRYLANASGSNARFAIRYCVVNGGPSGTNSDFSGIDVLNVSAGGSGPVTCNYSWTSQTSGATATFYSVSTVSNMIAWAAGTGSTVRRTTDGGLTWTNANSTPGVIVGDIYNIYASSATEAFCTTSPGATFIYKTTNGGTSWTQVYTLAGGFINVIQMVSATEGYAQGDPVGGKFTILKTTDGGSTWNRMATEPTPGASEAGWNNSMIIVGSNIWFNTNLSNVIRSTDLGLTWTSVPLGGTTTTTYGSIHYNSATVGIASGSTGVSLSTNGGTSYTTLPTPPGTGNITSVEGNGTDFWYTRGTGIFRSTNSGTDFTSVHTSTGSFNDMDFAIVGGCPQGFAVGTTGAISRMVTSTGISNYNNEVPDAFVLKQNFPNPFNPTTNITFSIPRSGMVTLKVYDMVGKEVALLVNEVKSAGNYIVGFNAANLPSGAYFYRIESNNFVDTKKMLLIK